MTATAADTGFGTTFAYDSGGGSYVSLGEVTALTPPTMTRETADATHMGSTSGFREHIGGLRDGGEASVTMNYVPSGTSYDALKANLLADTAVNYKITFPDASTVIFSALITELGVEIPMADKMSCTAKFKSTGVPTWS